MNDNKLMILSLFACFVFCSAYASAQGLITIPDNGEVIAFSASHGSYPGTMAYDGVFTAGNNAGRWLGDRNAETPAYVTWQFTNDNSYIVTNYMIMAQHYNPSTRSPAAWTLEGSDDGANWTVVDTQTSQSFSSSEKKYYDVSFPYGYSYFKVNITSWMGSDQWSGIHEIQLYGDEYLGAVPILFSNLSSAMVGTTNATLRVDLEATNAVADVTVFWGTSNGQENVSWWENSADVGSWTNVTTTNISYAITGLTTNTTYYYTFRGTNDTTNIWAGTVGDFLTYNSPTGSLVSESFETPVVTSTYTGTNPTGWDDQSTGSLGGGRVGVGSNLTSVGYSNYDNDQALWLNVYNATPDIRTTRTVLNALLVPSTAYAIRYNAAASYSGYTIYADLFAGTNLLFTASLNPTTKNFSSHSVTQEWVSGTSDAGMGEGLELRLRVSGGAWNHHSFIDSLELTATSTASDGTAPTPDPMGWTVTPVQSESNTVFMIATNATDPNFVEYLFTNTFNGSFSGWQSSQMWSESGLSTGVTYTYRVKARDNSANFNETAWSDPVDVTIDGDQLFYSGFEWPLVSSTTSGTNPDGWTDLSTGANGGSRAGVADLTGSSYSNFDYDQACWLNVYNSVPVLETTTNTLDAVLEGFTQYTLTFDAASDTTSYTVYADLYADTNLLMTASVSPQAKNFSNYHGSNVWTSPGSSPYNGETLKIRLRVTGGAWNQQSYVDNLLLTRESTGGDSTPPTPDPMGWVQLPAPAADSGIFMVATNATDVSLVEYLFTNTVNGNISGWQDERIWVNTGLTHGVTYSYKVKARDKSANQNETAWSSEESATANRSIILYDSFEDPEISGRVTFSCPGWLQNSSALLNEDNGDNTSPYGTQVAHLGYQGGPSGKRIESTSISDVLTAGTQYTLTFNIGNVRVPEGTSKSNNEYTAELVAGSTVVGNKITTTSTHDMSETGTVSFTPDSDHPALGETVKVRFYHSGGDWQWQPIVDNVTLVAIPDETAPSPDPNGFSTVPFGINATSVVMTASNATDATGPVEYQFTNDTLAVASVWSTNRFWRNNGLTSGNSYDYRVRARDAVGNETAWSPVSSATAEKETDAPTPDPMTFSVVPVSVNSTTIAMTATTATDEWNEPVQYYFENTTNSANSGWTTNPSWTNTGLTPTETYGYRVKARDAVSNETAFSSESLATAAPDSTPPNPDPMGFEILPAAIDASSVTMTASNATDFSSPVEYYFENVSNAVNSGWISSRVWTNGSLISDETYGYRVKARDAVSNETAFSTVENVTVIAPAVTIFYESFENPPHDDITGFLIDEQNSQGWTRSGTAGLLDEDSAKFSTPYGSQAAAMDDSGSYTTSTNLTNALQAAVMYELSFNIASENGNSVVYRAQLLAGSTVIGRARATVASSDMSASDLIRFTAPPGHADIGQPLSVTLIHPNENTVSDEADIYFDNVRLTTTDTGGDSTAPGSPTWVVEPFAVADRGLHMVASEVSDLRDVQYIFSNTVNGITSGWQDDYWWTETNLTHGLPYSYRIKARDNSDNLNESTWSVPATGTVDSAVIFYESFESPRVYRSGSQTADGWNSFGSIWNEDIGSVTTDYGEQAAYLSYNGNSSSRFIQNTAITETLSPYTVYTLSFVVGENGSASNVGYHGEILAGSTVVTNVTGTTTGNILTDTASVTIQIQPGHPQLGETVSVKLYSHSSTYPSSIIVDHVRLRALSLPRGSLFRFK